MRYIVLDVHVRSTSVFSPSTFLLPLFLSVGPNLNSRKSAKSKFEIKPNFITRTILYEIKLAYFNTMSKILSKNIGSPQYTHMTHNGMAGVNLQDTLLIE